MKALAAAFLAAAHLAQAQDFAGEQVLDLPWPTIPSFHGSTIYFRDTARHNRIAAFATDNPTERVYEAPPGSEALSLALDGAGNAALSWLSPGGRAGIEFFDATGRHLRSLDTGRYVPAHIAFAPDRTLWSFGWQRDAASPRKPSTADYATVRQFSPGQGELAALLPRMLLLPGDEPGNASWQRRQIAVMAGRIGILAHPSSRSPKREWIEIDLQGQVSGRWPVPFPVDRVAATPNGAVYLESGENATRILAKLNRATATWEKLERAPAGILCGVEAGALVFADWIRGQLRLRWYPELN